MANFERLYSLMAIKIAEAECSVQLTNDTLQVDIGTRRNFMLINRCFVQSLPIDIQFSAFLFDKCYKIQNRW